MNQKISEVYQTNEVNPLAGCLPSLVQIPVFIGLYRAVLGLAKENQLDEPFLFLPNLEGPVYGADPTQGSAWLFSNWVDGAPSLGWSDTISFLILPVFLVISQFISMELMTPKDQQQQGNFVLKLLPLMIGWFSLNVPAALCLYWVTNNIVTTATSLIIRNSMPKLEPVSAGGGSAVASPPEAKVFTPPPIREKPAGFSSPSSSPDGVTPITAIDAEIVDSNDNEDETPEGMGTEEPAKKVRTIVSHRSKALISVVSFSYCCIFVLVAWWQEKEEEKEKLSGFIPIGFGLMGSFKNPFIVFASDKENVQRLWSKPFL